MINRWAEEGSVTFALVSRQGTAAGHREEQGKGTENLGIKCQRKSRYRVVWVDEKGRSGETGGNHIHQDHLFQFGET